MPFGFSASTRLEIKNLSLLMGPIFITQLSQAAFGFVDTIMAGRASALDLAGVALGVSLWLPVVLLVCGILMATTPLVASAFGANNPDKIRATVHEGVIIAFIIGCLGGVSLNLFGPLFDLLNTPLPLRHLTQDYLLAMSLGMPASAIFCVLRCYVEALNKPFFVTYISIFGVILNAILNYALIYGHWGFPALGGVGCGVASACVMWFMLIALCIYCYQHHFFKKYSVFSNWKWPSFTALQKFLSLGVPIGAALFFETTFFAIVAVLISPLGVFAVASHQIAFSVTSMLFMIPLSLSIAMSIRIGHAYGAKDKVLIQRIRKIGLSALVLMASTSACLILIFRHQITPFYSNIPDVQHLAANLLLFAASYQVMDALQVGAAGCLRGLHDSKGPMILTLLAYWLIALPIGFLLGMTNILTPALGPYGLWAGLVIGLTLAAVFLNLRLSQQIRQLNF